MTDTLAPPRLTPYELVGGKAVVRRMVDRFYDLMDADPAFADLRALHAPDLHPMRDSLTGFLAAWLGGPRDWFDQRPGRCMMSAHRNVPISEASARQWAEAMTCSVRECVADAGLAEKMAEALSAMALGMAGIPTR